jgi:hypothetical protein
MTQSSTANSAALALRRNRTFTTIGLRSERTDRVTNTFAALFRRPRWANKSAGAGSLRLTGGVRDALGSLRDCARRAPRGKDTVTPLRETVGGTDWVGHALIALPSAVCGTVDDHRLAAIRVTIPSGTRGTSIGRRHTLVPFLSCVGRTAFDVRNTNAILESSILRTWTRIGPCWDAAVPLLRGARRAGEGVGYASISLLHAPGRTNDG